MRGSSSPAARPSRRRPQARGRPRPEKPPRLDERAAGSCAARACRRRARTAAPGCAARPRARTPAPRPGARRRSVPPATPSVADDVVRRVRGVGEDDVAGASRIRVLACVHRHGSRRAPLRVMERDKVVDHRRPHPARCGGYIQSVKSRASNGPSSRSAAGCRARLHAVRTACEAGSGQSRGSTPVPRALPDPGRARAGWSARRRRPRADPGRRGEAGERAADVVADPRSGMRQRRDVDDDPHAPGRSRRRRSARRAASSDRVLPGRRSGNVEPDAARRRPAPARPASAGRQSSGPNGRSRAAGGARRRPVARRRAGVAESDTGERAGGSDAAAT